MDKRSQGTLPSDDPVKVWGGKGTGRSCDGCDELISSSDAEHDVERPDGRTLRFHVARAEQWRVLKQAMPKS